MATLRECVQQLAASGVEHLADNAQTWDADSLDSALADACTCAPASCGEDCDDECPTCHGAEYEIGSTTDGRATIERMVGGYRQSPAEYVQAREAAGSLPGIR